MTCMGWLCSPRKTTTGRSRKECAEGSLRKKASVNEEYLGAFRTKSYMEICNKAQVELGKTKNLSSSSSSSPLCMKLTEYLLEPRQETIASMTQNLKVHHLVVEYFEASLEACQCCDKILEAIHSTRIAYRRMKRVINKLSKVVLDDGNSETRVVANKDVVYRELASFTWQNNPLSIISATQFREIRESYVKLLQRLKSKRGEIRRKIRVKRVCKNIGGIALLTTHCVVLIALLVLAFHSMVGIVAAPSLVGGLVGLAMKRRTFSPSCCHSSKRLLEQVDVAARGVYIMVNDLDTMSRMVKRLHGEVEHRKVVADVCVRNNRNGKLCELMLLKQVVREFHQHESSFLEQLEELEEHIYLCFLTTNRSRTLLLHQITHNQRP